MLNYHSCLYHIIYLTDQNDNSDGLFSFVRFKEKNYGSSGATSGLTSSLAFTPVQVSFTFIVSVDFLLLFRTIISIKVVNFAQDGYGKL